MSSLVVYYSRTGTTGTVAEILARRLGADVEGIREATDRLGLRGYVRSLFDATLSRWVPIASLAHDPRRYDLVVVGTPVWGASVSAPVRTFLSNHARRLPTVAFFATEGGRGERRVFRQMEEVLEAHPVATLAVTQRDVERGRVSDRIVSFADSLLKTSLASSQSTRLAS